MKTNNFAILSIISLSLIANYCHADETKLNQCLNLAQTNPLKAIEFAQDWQVRFGGNDANYCAANAYINAEQYEKGAIKFAILANNLGEGMETKKAGLFSQSANAFLLAQLPDNALNMINKSLELIPDNADFHIDRARIYMLQKSWNEAANDLTRAMTLRGELPLALRLRAEAKMQQQLYEAAQKDIDKAIKLEPNEGDNYYIRGRIIEAKRLGHAPN